MGRKRINRTGEEGINNFGSKMVITRYNDAKNIEKYNYKTKLYINKKTLLPEKIEVLDNSNQIKIYIEYKEIKLNNIRENNIFALKTNDIKNTPYLHII